MITISGGTIEPRVVLESHSWALSGELEISVLRLDGHTDHYGVVSRKLVTLVAIGELLAVLSGGSSPALGTFCNHAVGTGTASEKTSDIALGDEVATRAVGTQTIVPPNKYQTIGVITADFNGFITEHGVFSDNNKLLDRSKFSAIGVSTGELITARYVLTLVGS